MKGASDNGFTLIELIIGLIILGILLAMGAPSFANWLQNSQIRNASESIQNGLTRARSEAIRRNTTVRFQLVTSIDSNCELSSNSNGWVVSLNDPTSACGNAASNDTAPRIVGAWSTQEGAPNAVISGNGTSLITFNGTGQASTASTIDVTNPSRGSCSPGGNMRCLSIRVTTGGQIRMCDPARSSTDPQGC